MGNSTKPFLSLEVTDGKMFAKKAHPNVVIVVAVTSEGKFILTEQYREPVDSIVVEFVAGHIGDDPGNEEEVAEEAAKREMMEESGYTGNFLYLGKSASSPGMTDEINHFVLATELLKVSKGGGVGDENIIVHEVPINCLSEWMNAREGEGKIISAKTYAGLWMARHHVKETKTYAVIGRKLRADGSSGDISTILTTSSSSLAADCASSAIRSGAWYCVEIKGE